MKSLKIYAWVIALIIPSAIFSSEVTVLRKETDLLWLCIASFLVFFMQAGFAYVESGFTRSKNTVNILMKNIIDFAVGALIFWLIGFSIMFGPLLIASFGIGLPSEAGALLDQGDHPNNFSYGFFLFQMVFCATAATIVSGAMAERMRFLSYIIYSVVVSGLIYPVFGSLAWSGLFTAGNDGYLAKIGFIDFAGSTVVHSIGAWIGLAGTIMLGPRIGKFAADGTVTPLLGHNMSMATLGVFILWFGWFGFNPGSTGAVGGGSFAFIAVNTNMAACAGGVSAMILSWILFHKPDVTMVINGLLAGLVAITAGCNDLTTVGSIITGAVAGVVVIAGVLLLDKIKVDDPVGAISAHGFAGAWGTLAVGLLANPNVGSHAAGLFNGGGFKQLLAQLQGVMIAFVWSFGISLLLFYSMKKTIGLRVEDHEELEGLDIAEHGQQAYPEEV